MHPTGRGAVIMKVMEARKAVPPMGEPEEEGGDFASKAGGHCKEGLAMAKEYLNGEEGQNSPLRPKVEALAAAYEDLLGALGASEGEEEA